MTNDKCPHCGAKRCEVEPLTHIYLCGSSETLRHADCYERQLARMVSAMNECCEWCDSDTKNREIVDEVTLILSEALNDV